MSARTVRTAFARMALLAALPVLAACGDGGAPADADVLPARRARGVAELELPTASQEEADAALREARVFLDAGKEGLAEPHLRRAVELAPGNAEALRLLGEGLVARGKLDDAAEVLRRAVAATPKDPVAHDLLVRALKGKGDLEAAETACRAWTQGLADDDDAWFQLGTILLERGRVKESIQALRRAEGIRSARADVRTQLALALAADGQLDKAEAKFKDALQRDPSDADAWFQYGDLLSRMEPPRLREAGDAIARAVELNERHTLAHVYLYRLAKLVSTTSGDADDVRAERAWREILRHQARVPAGSAALGVAPRRDGDEEQSEFLLREAATDRPDDAVARLEYAKFLHRERRFDEAVLGYRRAIELGAADWRTRCRLAIALLAEREHRGRSEDASAGSAAAADRDARAARVRDAEEQVRLAIEEAPNEPLVRRIRAWTLLLSDRPDDAVAEADAALVLAADDKPTQRLHALARIRAGEIDAGMHELAACGWFD